MTYQLSYRLELREQAVFSQLGGDPNSVTSEGYVPGSAIWGGLAGLVIHKLKLGQLAHQNELFQGWFLREGLRCLNAYPLDPQNEDQRLLPAPLSIQKEKSNPARLHDLAAYYLAEEATPDETLKRLEGFSRITGAGETLVLANSRTTFNYHTTRANRLKGRAAKTEGAVFVYEALEGDQTFSGLILGEAADLTELQKTLGWQPGQPLTLRLGRSRATQYGGSIELVLLSAGPEEFISEVPNPLQAELEPDSLVVTLTSHLLLRAENGYPAPLLAGEDFSPLAFPNAQLAAALGLDRSALVLRQSYAERGLVSGYSAVWGLPRPQWPAFKAGSVFVFEIRSEQPDLTAAPAASLGCRAGEGYGRFVLNWHGQKKNLTAEKPKEPDKLRQPAAASETFRGLVKNLVGREFERQAESAGRLDSLQYSDAPDTFKYLTPALLGRLQQALHAHPDPADFEKWLDSLRRPAQQQLERVRSTKSGSPSLNNGIRQVLQADSVYRVGSSNSIQLDSKGAGEVIAATRPAPALETDPALLAQVKQTYLLALVGELSRRIRERGEAGSGEQN